MSILNAILLNEHNIATACRVCLEQKSNLLSMFANIEIEDENLGAVSIGDMLVKLTSEAIQEERGVPAQICVKCVSLLRAAYVFKLKFEESTGILDFYLSTFNEQKPDIIEILDDDECNNDSLEVEEYQPMASVVEETTANEQNTDKTVTSEQTETRVEVTKESEDRTESSKQNENKTEQDEADDESADSDESTERTFVYVCPICPTEFPTSLDLKKHAYSHIALNKYLALKPENKKNVKYFAEPRSTVSIFTRKNILHKCTYCNDYLTGNDYGRHVGNHTRHGVFKCDKCDRVFRKINHLNTHRSRHLKEYPYKCPHCQKGFVIKRNYDYHLLRHTASNLPYECLYCLKTFSNPMHLRRHQMVHTEKVSYAIKYKSTRCRRCFKGFSTKADLKSHACEPIAQPAFPTRNGTICKKGITLALCSVCGRYVRNLYTHMDMHNQERPHQCDLCGKRFVSLLRLRLHIRIHTGEKPYQCDQCDKRFLTTQQLKRHYVVHTGAKPYICSMCAKAFNNPYNLQVHERIHKGNKEHVCGVCGKGFLEKTYLQKHMKVHWKKVKEEIFK